MPKITLELPSMYGDHHVTAVRRLLLDLDGVEDVYASSSFHFVEVSYDEALLSEEQIHNALEDAGYFGDLLTPAESGLPAVNENGGKTYFRHSSAFEQTGKAINFSQNVPDRSRPLWPCPGIGVVKGEEEELTHG